MAERTALDRVDLVLLAWRKDPRPPVLSREQFEAVLSRLWAERRMERAGTDGEASIADELATVVGAGSVRTVRGMLPREMETDGDGQRLGGMGRSAVAEGWAKRLTVPNAPTLWCQRNSRPDFCSVEGCTNQVRPGEQTCARCRKRRSRRRAKERQLAANGAAVSADLAVAA
jgi:hypothetical protein